MKGEIEMPVAKTYTNFKIEGEIFRENNKSYVNIITPKGLKKVRWYTETEYRRMYPNESIKVDNDFNAKHAFGFDNGYITLYKGARVKEWAENNRTNIWYNLLFGYYTPGKLDLPTIDADIEPIRLNWEDICANNTQLKSDEEVQKYVYSLISTSTISSVSEFQGTENEWLEKEIIIKKNTTRSSHFGDKHTHIMADTQGNTYLWETGAKNLEVGMETKLKMKVKEHKEINGEKCTVVWYCKEV